MTRWERWGFNTFHVVVGVTGFVYFYMKYLMTTDDPFAIVNHPWESTTLSLHLVAAPFFVAFFGMLFRSHSIRKILSSNLANRRTGWTSLISFSVMAVSGYLIQVMTTPALIAGFVWLHIVTSTFFVVGYGIHLIIGYRISRLPTGTPDTALPGSARLSL
ncbi:MAG TPA: hypothetical protein EYO94_11405 [Acidobacteria bacterium]|nr:hypothetical protein [Acidobacteriota bacterium]